MLDFLDAIPPEWKPLALFIFVVMGAVSAALTYLKGKKAGPEKKVTELYASGHFYDMGPVQELVEQTGLLYQQQVRTNIALEAVTIEVRDLAKSAAAASNAYTAHLEDQELDEKLERLMKAREQRDRKDDRDARDKSRT